MTIFERIKELADKQGKSLQKVSEELGFSSNYLYQLKRQTPAADKLIKLSKYFNVSVDYLLGLTQDNTVHEANGVLIGGVMFAESELKRILEMLEGNGATIQDYASWVKDESEYQSKMWKDIKDKAYFDEFKELPVALLWKLNELDNFYRANFELSEREVLHLLNTNYYVLKAKAESKEAKSKERQLMFYSEKMESLLSDSDLQKFNDELFKIN
ncbi:Transcriptional regulator [Lactococcus lactis subsp. lactis]|nr:Transcriptional regulator [Lactococcus lactis subsp. lactis]